MLNEKDLCNIQPYLAEGRVINIEVKDRNRKGREIILEYDDGRKLVGNLDASPVHLIELTGLTSIASYFARGKYGNPGWRGNCSGLLIRDLLNHYKPDTFADLAVGSGTSIDVAKELGYTRSNSVFNDLNPKYGGVDISGDDMDFPLVDMIFFHPPYYVFPGSSMPVYSGKQADGKGMWGTEVNAADGSRISDPWTFKLWLDKCNRNLYQLLRKGGRMAVLLGDSKYRGSYFSAFKEMDVFGKIEQVIIKTQHNCVSENVRYSGKFIPLEHEYLVIIRKDEPYFIPVTTINHHWEDVRADEKATWANVLAMILEANGGRMTINEAVAELERTPKAKKNKNVRAKVRQELQYHRRMFSRDGDYICLAAPA